MLFLLLFAGCIRDTPVTRLPTSLPTQGRPIIAVAAGDISCDPNSSKFQQGRGTARHCRMLATSDLAIALNPAAVFVLGDSQYEKGKLEAYRSSWAHNWGREKLRDITYPAVGNHEYKTKDASGYFEFFGPRAGERGKGYYSFNLGTWHIVALNSGGNDKCRPVSCGQGSEQEIWLRRDLEKNTSSCTMAFWHRPLFTSGRHRGALEVKPFWRDLYAANADIVLNGHSHHYERFSPQTPDGISDPQRGITQFVVGTGGRNLKGFWGAQPNSLVRNAKSFGVLKLMLGEKSYAWEFLSVDGPALDGGTTQCHPKGHSVSPEGGAL
jgi:hypothetical protein